MSKPQVILDIECYHNYFLVMFLRCSDNQTIAIETHELKKLDYETIKQILLKYEVVTFNGNSYDIPMLKLALNGATASELKFASNDIIVNELSQWKFEKTYSLYDIPIDHIDLIELTPGKSSLKIYGGRLHCEKMQDLPIKEGELISEKQRELLKEYCKNDLLVTKLILEELKGQIELRRNMSSQYKVDLRSKSDAQIAETVIKSELRKISPITPVTGNFEKQFYYNIPEFIKPSTDKLSEVFNILKCNPFTVKQNGKIDMPKELQGLKIKIGKTIYQMGMGGLHSTEKSVNYTADENHILCDWDVASYYPAIILNCKLFPKQLGEAFLTVYKSIVDTRLEAKRTGDKIKADSLKITVNGSFGKLGSPYSNLYAPELMIQVTVTGQLSLLMLIDTLELNGISVVSGNTDGIVIRCRKADEKVMGVIIDNWQAETGFTMERTDYKSIYSRDVNNYIAIKTDGKVKTKGCFSSSSLNKNPQNEICNMAVIEYIKSNSDLMDTLKSCKDVTKFVTVRNVKGGAVKGNVYLGKAVRWYYSNAMKGTINYKSNGNTVPRSFGAKPIMQLTNSLPTDIDYKWYLEECKDLLCDLGVQVKGQQTFNF